MTKIELQGVPQIIKVACTLEKLQALEMQEDAMYKLYVSGNPQEIKMAKDLLAKRRKASNLWNACTVVYEKSIHRDTTRTSTSLKQGQTTLKRLSQLVDMHLNRLKLKTALEIHLSSIGK